MWSDSSSEEEPANEPEKLPERLLWAAGNGRIDIVNEVISQDKSIISQSDRDGYTALHRAASEGHLEIIKILLSNNADVTSRTVDGWTSLHCACRWNEVVIADLLIKSGADVNALSNGNVTPLHAAANEKNTRNVLLLLLDQHDIDLELRTHGGDTAYDLAKRCSRNAPLFELASPHLNTF